MKKFRFISALLTFIMVFGAIGNLSILPVYAATKTEEVEKIDYLTEIFDTAEDKLATMELKLDAFGYELYYEKNTGEVAYREKSTGQIMFTNPYDIPKAFPGGLSSSADTKALLLSQVVIRYTDNDKEVNFYSYTEAAARNQIVQKNIKNGIRVEYTMGREETRKLVPRLINKERFEELVLAYIDDPTAYKKITAFYTLKDPNDPELTERAVKELQATFKITTKMAVYVFDPYASERELNLIESYIKTYCPHYTYETLQEDHTMTDYSGSDAHPALFKLSLEYYLDEDGLTVRLPANGIRFDEGNYSLTYIMVLPFMGAGSSDYTGYTFYPDGSGTLVRFEDIKNTRTITGELYGMDFAYHKLTSNRMETLRLPVYGVVENYKATVTSSIEEEIPGYFDDYGDYIEPTIKTTTLKEDVKQDRGYLAIIEEGDALAKITTNHGAFILHRYNSVYTTFYPRPKDSYNLAESISVGANAEWTVVSKRKYTGSYRIRFIMLTDKGVAEENNIKNYYECSYVGMAKVYRDYLEKQGILTRLTENDVKKDIPLYIESFGIMDVLDTFMSIPVIVKTPLTTFENLATMYSELSEAGISNINFRLKGFTNGGMQQTVPYHVKFEKKSGGNSGYQDFLQLAAANGFGVFPDFDFLYADRRRLTDGFTARTDAIKTIDNRYTRKRVYDSATQSLRRTGLLAISPAALSKFYNKFSPQMVKLGLNGISVATLGTDLNSDFNKKAPYNREDAKRFVLNIFDDMYNDCSNIMVDGGNAYTLKYASHILNASIDSSRHTYASEMVPFLGMVLHGYISFAGSPTNMAGDMNYEILKIIENGAAPYFTLSYQNISELKKDWRLSDYYSVSYEIWFDDLVRRYNQINDALGALQTSLIDNHEFLIGERIPTEREIAEDLANERAEAEAKAEAEALKAEKDALKKNREAYLASLKGETLPEETAPVADDDDDEEEPDETDENKEYVYTRYTIDNGSIVKVTYDNGTSFILNYNNFVVTTEGYTVPAIGYLKIVD